MFGSQDVGRGGFGRPLLGGWFRVEDVRGSAVEGWVVCQTPFTQFKALGSHKLLNPFLRASIFPTILYCGGGVETSFLALASACARVIVAHRVIGAVLEWIGCCSKWRIGKRQVKVLENVAAYDR